MAAIHHEVIIDAPTDAVWDAVQDVGSLHSRLVPGFVIATTVLVDAATLTRRVTFADGTTVDEVIIDVDPARHRLSWSIQELEHHNGVMEVVETGAGTMVSWTADVLPHSLTERFSPAMEAGLAIMKRHLEANCHREKA